MAGVLLFGVTDGTRTRDSQDHNLVLYQLNYGHHLGSFTSLPRCSRARLIL